MDSGSWRGALLAPKFPTAAGGLAWRQGVSATSQKSVAKRPRSGGSRPRISPPPHPKQPCLDAPEAVDRVLESGPLLGVADAEAFLGGHGEDPDLALVGVVLHVAGGLPDVLHGVDLGQGGVDQAAVDEPVGLPGLPVVGEVAADDPLEVHPEVAVVVLVHVAAGRGASDDDAALAHHVDRGAEGLPARVLEHDVDVVAPGQLADALAEPVPLLGVLVVLVLP